MEGIDQIDGTILLAVARERIASHLFNRVAVYPNEGAGCAMHAGAFVTLKEHGLLRGCIGRMKSRNPVFETIKDMAYSAAFEDPRFVPLAREELDHLHIEITVLSPMVSIRDTSEIVVGKHGIYISFQDRTGVFLPQVALEQGWNREEFLEHLCKKAGVPPNSWKDPRATISIFEGVIFEE